MEKLKRALVTILIAALAVGVMPMQAQAASPKSKALKAYKNLLTKKTMWWDDYYTSIPTNDCKFTIAYIDNDFIPELIIYSTHVTHVSAWGRVYTYKNGKAQMIGYANLDDGKFHYYKKKGVFISKYIHQGYMDTYFKIEKGKVIKKLETFKTALRTNNKKYYYKYISDNKSDEISKKSFHKALKKMVGSKKVTTAKLHKNTSGNRKKYLK